MAHKKSPSKAKANLSQNSETVKKVSLILLFMMPLIGAIFPRFMAYGPGLVAVIGAGLSFFLFKDKFPLSRAAFIGAGLVLAIATLSSLWSLDPGFALERAGKMVLILFPGALLLSWVASIKVETIRSLIWLLPIFVGLGVLFNINELTFHTPVYRLFHSEIEPRQNSLSVANRGTFCVMAAYFFALPVLLYHDRFERVKRHAIMLLTVCTFVLFYLSDSQSNQLGFLIGLFLLLVFPYKRDKAWKGLSSILVILMLSAPFIASWAFHHFASVAASIEWLSRGFAADRLEIWDFVARYALQNPLYGYGIEATRLIENFDTAKMYHQSGTVLHPHNFALQLWIEFGLIGVALGIGFVLWMLNNIRSLSIQGIKVALPTFFMALSVASTGYGLWQGWWLGQCIMLAALVILVIRTQD